MTAVVALAALAAAVICGVVAAAVALAVGAFLTVRSSTRDLASALFVEHRQLLNMVAANTPKDFGILKKLDAQADAVSRETPKTSAGRHMSRDEYNQWVRDDFEKMGLDPNAADAMLNAATDIDLPVRPHGLG